MVDNNGSLGIQLVQHEDGSGRFQITNIQPNSPADRAKILRIGDVLTRVNGSGVLQMNLDELKTTLGGKPGSAVTLGFERGQQVFAVTLVRERPALENNEQTSPIGASSPLSSAAVVRTLLTEGRGGATPPRKRKEEEKGGGEDSFLQWSPEKLTVGGSGDEVVMEKKASSTSLIGIAGSSETALLLSERHRMRAEAEVKELSAEIRQKQAATEEYCNQLRRRCETSAAEAREEAAKRVELEGRVRLLVRELEELRSKQTLTISTLEERAKTAEAEAERARESLKAAATSSVASLREEALERDYRAERSDHDKTRLLLDSSKTQVEALSRNLETKDKEIASLKATIAKLEQASTNHQNEMADEYQRLAAEREAQFERQLAATKTVMAEMSNAVEEASQRESSARKAAASWEQHAMELESELKREQSIHLDLRRTAHDASEAANVERNALKAENEAQKEIVRNLEVKLLAATTENKALHEQVYDINMKYTSFAAEVSQRCFWELERNPPSSSSSTTATTTGGSRPYEPAKNLPISLA